MGQILWCLLYTRERLDLIPRNYVLKKRHVAFAYYSNLRKVEKNQTLEAHWPATFAY